ncbi:MAG: neutral zinc metallopeptidase [Actinobacteria bacterium]|nr:neutral zinc metallopeptidase [Actinomycetota bacterium]
MKWQDRRKSTNVEDRRGIPAKGAAIGGGVGGGILIVIIIVILTICTGGDIGNLSDISGNTQASNLPADTAMSAAIQDDEIADFAKVIFADIEDVWTEIFNANGMEYVYPTLVLYTDYVQSGCGAASSSTGPFYCPADYKVYIDLIFFQELQHEFNAPGDFAMAYVMAHEVGHHIQTILGIMEDVQSLQSQMSQAEANEYNVRLELQADYLAGVWAHYVNKYNYLEEGDIEEALNAASAVGDDRIQEEHMGYAVPDTFTHGTSEQRRRWFYKGFKSGTLEEGDTFAVDYGDL